MILKLNPEFAHELVLGIPYAHWLHQQGKLEKMVVCKGMRPFYYFCDDVEESFDSRTINNEVAGVFNLPNVWIHHNATALLGKDYADATEEEQHSVNGCLDYSQWDAPDYKTHYRDALATLPRKYVVINNTYNIEFGRVGEKPMRSFSIECLYNLFVYFNDIGYDVLYKRPLNTEFSIDENERNSLSRNLNLTAEVAGHGEMNDYQLCDHFDNVHNIADITTEDDYNTKQLKLFANAEGFITVNGGGGILCCYFGNPVVMYVPDGKEKRPGYLTNDNSYIKRLSGADVIPVFEDPHSYTALEQKVKETFK